MPQPKRDAVHRHFIFDRSSNFSTCQLCNSKFRGNHTTNLKNHMAVKHVKEYRIVTKINKEKNKTIKRKVAAETRNASTVDALKILCVKLVAVHGRPLAIINDEAFQEIVNLATPHANRNIINTKSIKSMIPEIAYDIREKISAEIRNRMISLKLDLATYIDKSFVGINIQYFKDSVIFVRNLAVVEVDKIQTEEHLKKNITETLNQFKISKDQLYSICTDYRKLNMKITKFIGEQYQTENVEVNDEPNMVWEDDWNDTDDDNLDENECVGSNSNIQENVFNSSEINLTNFIDLENDSPFSVRGMLCAAHSLQLAIKDAIQDNVKIQVTIELCRMIVKILRRPANKISLKVANLKKPIIDCPDRWTSTYNMLSRLVTYKSICEEITDICGLVSEQFWEKINLILEVLEPANATTLVFQKEQLTIGDFYITWLQCKKKLEPIKNRFSISLLNAMERREQNLFQNDVVLEALYLDTRINVMLTKQQCDKARFLLNDTYRQIQTIKVHSEDNKDLVQNTYEMSTASTSNDLSALEQMMIRAESIRRTNLKESTSFETSLYELVYTPRIPLHENIIQHWNNKAIKCSDLASVANVVLAAPATQVSVERLFSSLKYILNPLRRNLDPSFLYDLMLIRSNKDLF